MERCIGDTMDNTNIHEMLLSEYKALSDNLTEHNRKTVMENKNGMGPKPPEMERLGELVDEMNDLAWKVINNTQDSSLRECLKQIRADYSFNVGTMGFLLEDLIKMKAYLFTVGEPVDNQVRKSYFREDFGRVYSYELPERIFEKRRILLIFLDENGCFKKCLYGEIDVIRSAFYREIE